MAIPTITYNSGTLASGTGNLVIAYPASIASGDLILLLCAADDVAGANKFTTPAGYTLEGFEGDSVSDSVITVFSKVADGTETGNISIATLGSGSRDKAGFCIRCTSAGADTDFGVFGTSTTILNSTVNAPSITTLEDDNLLFCLNGFDGDDGAPFTYGNSFTAIANAGIGGGAGIGIGFGTKSQASAGVVGSTLVTASASDGQVGFQISINAVAGGAAAPVNTVAPVISGSLPIPNTLTATTGTWTGTPTPTYSYQWKRGATNIGTDSSTYTTVAADDGQNITCVVTASNASGDVDATSNTLIPVLLDPPVNTVAPVISGDLDIPNTLTATTGTWTGAATITYSYQWKRGATNIGTDSATYLTVDPDDDGANITCVVTATNGDGSADATSNTLVPYVPVAPSNSVLPAISGALLVGSLLTATTGTWSGTAPITYSYQWKRGATNIGTDSATYTSVDLDAGQNITCVVTATNVVSGVTATSNTLAMDALAAPVNTVAPVISGTLEVGDTLTATTGTWTGNAVPTYTYQWKRGATNIGTNSAGYTTVLADGGENITCVITATNTTAVVTATSNTLAIIEANAPVFTVDPVITGDQDVGSVLTCDGGTVTGNPTVTLSYQWKRAGTNVGTDSATYTTVPADGGFRIKCRVTATNVAGSDAKTSNKIKMNEYVAPTAGGSFIIASRLESPAGSLEAIDYFGRTHDLYGGFIAETDLTLVASSIRVQKSGGLSSGFEHFIRLNNGTAVSLGSVSSGFESSQVDTNGIAIAAGDKVELLFSCGSNSNTGIGIAYAFEETLAQTNHPFIMSMRVQGASSAGREGNFSGNSRNFPCGIASPVAFTVVGIGYYNETGNAIGTHSFEVEVAGVANNAGTVCAIGARKGYVAGLSIAVSAGDTLKGYATDSADNDDDTRATWLCQMAGVDTVSNTFAISFQDTDLSVAQAINPFTMPVDCTLIKCGFASVDTQSSTIDVSINDGTAVEVLNYSITGSNMAVGDTLAIAIAAGDKIEIQHNGSGTVGLGGTTTLYFYIPNVVIVDDYLWPGTATDDFPDPLPEGQLNGASGGPQSNKITFQPELGPSIDRRAGSYSARYISIELPPMTPGQYLTWQNFFYVTLKNGSLPMSFPDPITKTYRQFQFRQGKARVQETSLPSGLIKVTFDLIRID